ncbi:hypothetical protein [Asticcacaulis sp. 201]|uniref:hypothetical protein n=1 Tax=Asticcacaulis sp. 201 TaxID=3028787 RepID=UPI002916694F|nr:hypothetical protein [Asticcacaulis sp. 201]MDV6332806.1 hypothetical protein [Asticcacaulis sp. 201]
MSKTLIFAAAIVVAFTGFTSAALAKETANQTTKRLNQQQTLNAPAAPAIAPAMANEAAARPDTEMKAQVPAETAPTEVYVAGAARTSTDAVRAPDTNPQSTGTAMVDTPYVAIVPAKK